ncbi:DUF4003 family protein [Sporosarcina siberiensis]|uniref:DUF4003 family protein n=1 Tax=Sporosarcina siberiensis TaxID=1365606 RepID=A0ABW4SKM0_9BACL
MDTNGIVNEVDRTYKKVKSLAGWTVDKNVVLTITSYYVTSEREFFAENLNHAMDSLKENSSWLSPLRGNLLPMIAAFLDKPGVDINEETARLFHKQRVLRNEGFRNTIHSYLAALLMTDDSTLYEQEAKNAKSLYNEMKKTHFFLTSDDDYAYAVLLAKKNENPVEHARSMRLYYDALRVKGLRSGDELQWMSQLMTYVDINFEEQLVSRAISILDCFKKEAKVQPLHYPMVAFLTVFGVSNTEITEIIELTHALEDSKLFSWNKEMALSIAMGYIMRELTDSHEEIGVSLIASIELIVQAQQAVIAATMASMAASSANNPANH